MSMLSLSNPPITKQTSEHITMVVFHKLASGDMHACAAEHSEAMFRFMINNVLEKCLKISTHQQAAGAWFFTVTGFRRFPPLCVVEALIPPVLCVSIKMLPA
ncbi:hypothetical protein V6N13_061005 [Hibiscus sabdariffa]|uniref:Uncharacterized protein n=1 Tax=Hibiscus sabdariffa TaxID=183260 RepID=A0ABR2N8Y9_9ROSI